MKVQELKDDQLRHAIQCDDCKSVKVVDTSVPGGEDWDVQLCPRGLALGDSKRVLREELGRRDRERIQAR